ncbi:Protein of unknown function DUF2184 [uncultured Caudovirales phage]|uniref:DUF2184 domain-containing protein n=1 Tax=uncultured Caudovirales phage TaxID=2100421 RepID=A0A6J7WZ56_9CAUD|nr:Protein of unknown function DUF2184 [uncultured Caudovirales phage]
MNAQLNLDASQTAYFNRQLEVIKAQTYDVKQGALRALELFPVDPTTPEHAETQTYYQYDARGIAKIISDYASDLPSIEVAGKSFTTKIETIGLSYSYSLMDIKRAAIAGTPLNVRKAVAAQRGIFARHNQLFWNGDAATGIVGILSHASVPNAQVTADGTGTSPLWSTKTPVQILRDLTQAVTEIITVTKGVETPNLLVLSASRLQVLRSTLMATNTDRSILGAFQLMYPNIRVEGAEELAGAFTGGAEGFLLGRNEATHIELIAPVVYEEEAPQQVNLSALVPASGRNGGAAIYYPLAFSKKYGI